MRMVETSDFQAEKQTTQKWKKIRLASDLHWQHSIPATFKGAASAKLCGKERMAHEYYMQPRCHSPLKLASRYSSTWKNLRGGARIISTRNNHLTVQSSQLRIKDSRRRSCGKRTVRRLIQLKYRSSTK